MIEERKMKGNWGKTERKGSEKVSSKRNGQKCVGKRNMLKEKEAQNYS